MLSASRCMQYAREYVHAAPHLRSAQRTSWAATSFVTTHIPFPLPQLTWRIVPVLTKKDIKRLEDYREYVGRILSQEKGERLGGKWGHRGACLKISPVRPPTWASRCRWLGTLVSKDRTAVCTM